MTPETVTVVLPLPPKVLSPNCAVATPGGRFAKAAATKKYRRLVKEAVEAEGIETAPWKKIEVSAEFFFKDRRRRDTDNAIATLKAMYDGIVDAGLVVDDTPEHMRRWEPDFVIDRDCPRLLVTITRLQ